MLRILLVAPGTGLQTTAEVRDLSTLHRVTILSDTVTVRDVFTAARGRYDVIHLATHSDDTSVQLSDGILRDSDLLQIARSASAKLVFFNSCRAGRLAYNLVGHGVPLAIHTNVELVDSAAWKMPLAYYGAVDELGNGTPLSYVRAFVLANDGEGDYGLAVDPELAISWATMAYAATHLAAQPPLSQWQRYVMIGMAVIVFWLLALSVFSI